jgi:hypothetical protein
MHGITASELLSTWERGLALSPVQRALSLLRVACPEIKPDLLAEICIGERDSSLLILRSLIFGPHLKCLVVCPGCGERLELNLETDDLRTLSDLESADKISLTCSGIDIEFRLPNSLDLLAIAKAEDIEIARRILLERCIIQARMSGEDMPFDQLPCDAMDAVSTKMALADPQADIQIALSCSTCSDKWQETFDIVSFFWEEINSWAYRTLLEVHTLASAYGWSESEILNMSPLRRQFYLEMLGG